MTPEPSGSRRDFSAGPSEPARHAPLAASIRDGPPEPPRRPDAVLVEWSQPRTFCAAYEENLLVPAIAVLFAFREEPVPS